MTVIISAMSPKAVLVGISVLFGAWAPCFVREEGDRVRACVFLAVCFRSEKICVRGQQSGTDGEIGPEEQGHNLLPVLRF